MRPGKPELYALSALLLLALCPRGLGAEERRAIPDTVIVEDIHEASPLPAGKNSPGTPPDSLLGSVPPDSIAPPEEQPADTLAAPGELSADTLAEVEEPYAWLANDSLTSLPFDTPEDRGLIPGDIRVLTKEDIARTGVRTLGELFAWLADSEILDGGFTLDEQYLTLRGSLPHEVVVMVDGVRANEPATGLMDLRDVPVESISRIEILGGPMASLLAAEATEALIQITTCRHPGGEPASKIAILDGDGDLKMVEGSFSKKIRETGYMNLTASRIALQGLTENVPSTDLAVFARAGIDVRGIGIESWVRRTAIDREEEGGDSLGTHESFTFGFGAKRALREDLVLSGTFSRTAHEFGGHFDFPVEEGSESGRTTFEVSLLANRGEEGTVKTGFEWERTRLEEPDGDWQRLLRTSIYGVASFRPRPMEYVSLIAGGRVDRYRDETPDITAGLSLGVTALKHVKPYVSFSIGSFRLLQPAEDPEGYTLPDRDDLSTGLEAGSSFSPLERLEAHVSYMIRDFDDGPIYLSVPMIGDTLRAEEFPEYDSPRRSFKGTLRYEISSGFSVGLGYVRSSFGEFLGDNLTEVTPDPRTIISFTGSLRKSLKGDNLAFEGSFLAKRLYEGNMNLIDVTAGIRIVDVLIFFSGRNMLDERYEPYDGLAPHGRYAKWGFTWKFLD